MAGLNMQGLVQMMAQKNPQANGMIQQLTGMSQQGMQPNQIIDNMLQSNPNNQFLQAVKGKSPEEIQQYAQNLIQSMGMM